jgi:hypothetical protein
MGDGRRDGQSNGKPHSDILTDILFPSFFFGMFFLIILSNISRAVVVKEVNIPISSASGK